MFGSVPKIAFCRAKNLVPLCQDTTNGMLVPQSVAVLFVGAMSTFIGATNAVGSISVSIAFQIFAVSNYHGAFAFLAGPMGVSDALIDLMNAATAVRVAVSIEHSTARLT